MERVNERRYNEIKKLAIECINEFSKNKNGLNPIQFYMKNYKEQFLTPEEIVLFKNMVLFPDSNKLLISYKESKNINVLALNYGVSKETIASKLNSIAIYEQLYEINSKPLKISDVDVLDINKKIIASNNSIDRTLTMIKKSK